MPGRAACSSVDSLQPAAHPRAPPNPAPLPPVPSLGSSGASPEPGPSILHPAAPSLESSFCDAGEMLRQHAAARWLLPPPPGHPPRRRRYPSCILVTPRRRMLRPLRMMPILLPGPRRRSPPRCGERGVRPRRRAEPALAKGCSFGSRFPDGSSGFHRREHSFPWAKSPSGAQGRQEEPRAQSWEPGSAEHLRGCRKGGCAGCGDAGDEEMETPRAASGTTELLLEPRTPGARLPAPSPRSSPCWRRWEKLSSNVGSARHGQAGPLRPSPSPKRPRWGLSSSKRCCSGILALPEKEEPPEPRSLEPRALWKPPVSHSVTVPNLGKPLGKVEQPTPPGEQNPPAGGQAGSETHLHPEGCPPPRCDRPSSSLRPEFVVNSTL
ncbi:uncharacterized protein LOC141733501 [Larus michahellis]|uniref:uncharacterized protein LOC141733501 n=1 Tax=Larus michahellis TaxID=119627 RepID=UPI003D9BD55A